jgi:hypothetical protein
MPQATSASAVAGPSACAPPSLREKPPCRASSAKNVSTPLAVNAPTAPPPRPAPLRSELSTIGRRPDRIAAISIASAFVAQQPQSAPA